MEFENIEIGKEQPTIEPKTVKIVGYEEREVTKSDKSFSGKKLVLTCKHDDVGDIEISRVAYDKNKKIKETGLWITTDKDGNLSCVSAVAYLLRYLGVKTIKEIQYKEMPTVVDDNGYLIGKIY